MKFKEAQIDVQNMLDDEEKEADQSDWYEPKLVDFEKFMKRMEIWMDREDGATAGDTDDEEDKAVAVDNEHV